MEVFNILLTVFIALILLVVWHVKTAFSYWKSMGVPHDPPEIPFGNIRGVGKTLKLYQITQYLYNKYKGTSKICGIYLYTQADAIILDMELIKTILVRDFNEFCDRNSYYNEKDDPLSAHLCNELMNFLNMNLNITTMTAFILICFILFFSLFARTKFRLMVTNGSIFDRN